MPSPLPLIKRLVRSQYLRQSGLYVGLQQLSQITIGLLQVWVLATHLPRDAYGVWGYSAAFAGMATIFTLPGVSHVITYGAAHGQDGVLVAGVRLRLKFGVLTSLTLLVLAAAHYHSGRIDAAWLLFFAALFLPAQQAFDGVDAFLTGLGNFRALFFRRLAAQGFMVVALWLGAAMTGSVVVCGGILYGGGVVVSGGLFLSLLKLRRNREMPDNFKGMIKQFSLQSIGATLSRSMERPLLSAFVGFKELAAYNLAMTAQFPVSFGRLVDRILISRLARSKGQLERRQVLLGMGLLFGVGLPAYVLMVAVVRVLVPWILPHYGDAVPLIEILLLQAPFAWGAKPGMSWLLAHQENHRWHHRIVWGIIVARVGFISAGAWGFGMMGVAWAWVGVEGLTFLAVLGVLLAVTEEAEPKPPPTAKPEPDPKPVSPAKPEADHA
ncbi:MAG: hypothetical protein HQL52_00175 [Magnetococcales bacterium]|nr:hypothetical protein [Magnetococcales bacterium]